jgi:hypothetical protein
MITPNLYKASSRQEKKRSLDGKSYDLPCGQWHDAEPGDEFWLAFPRWWQRTCLHQTSMEGRAASGQCPQAAAAVPKAAP